jgi:hypothetical protein
LPFGHAAPNPVAFIMFKRIGQTLKPDFALAADFDGQTLLSALGWEEDFG